MFFSRHSGHNIGMAVKLCLFLAVVDPVASQHPFPYNLWGINDFEFKTVFPNFQNPGPISQTIYSDDVSNATSSEMRQLAQMSFGEIFPTRVISRGAGLPDVIPSETPRYDEEIESIVIEVNSGDDKMKLKLKDALTKSDTDGFMIMKDGKIIYEKYFGAFEPQSRHCMWSLTKSYAGLIAADLVEKNLINENDLVTDLVKYFQNTEGLQGVTVRMAMDMTASILYDEFNVIGCDSSKFYTGLRASITDDPDRVGIDLPIPNGCEPRAMNHAGFDSVEFPEFNYYMSNQEYVRWPGPQNFRDYLMSVKKSDTEGPDGERFQYKTAVTQLLSAVVEQVLQDKMGISLVKYFEKNVWSKLGTQADLMIQADRARFPFWGGGGQATLRDIAKFGDMLLNNGQNSKGEQIIPKAVVEDLKSGGTVDNLSQFSKAGEVNGVKYDIVGLYNSLVNAPFFENESMVKQDYLDAIGESDGVKKGWAYRNQFWVLPDHVVTQNGIYGQEVWVDYDANMVVAKFSSPDNSKGGTIIHRSMFLDLSTYFQKEFNHSPPKKSRKKSKGIKKGSKGSLGD